MMKSLVLVTLVSVGVAAGPIGSASADPPKRGPSFFEDNRAIMKADRFARDTWPRQYANYWIKFRGVAPKTRKDLWYFGFTDKAARKVKLLETRFPITKGHYLPVHTKRSERRIYEIVRESGEFLLRKAPDLTRGSLMFDWKNNAVRYTFLYPAPEIHRELKRRWGDAIRVEQPAKQAPASVRPASADRQDTVLTDRQTLLLADEFIKKNWSQTYGGYWNFGRHKNPNAKKIVYFVGFTRKSESRVEQIRAQYPLEDGVFKPVKVKRSLNDLLKIMNQLNRFIRKNAPDLTDGSLSLELSRNALGVEFLKPAPRIRKAIKKRFGDAVLITVAD